MYSLDDVGGFDLIAAVGINFTQALLASRLEAVAIESKLVVDIDEFVPKDEIDALYLSSPYYIAPDGEVCRLL